MYLMSLVNSDYVFITLFSALTFVLAYLFRRKNATVDAFLFAPEKKHLDLFAHIGIIELVIAGYAGAKLGVVSFFYIVCAIILIHMLRQIFVRKLLKCKTQTILEYIRYQFGSTTGLAAAILFFLLVMSLSVLAMCATFKVLHTLLGWNFANSLLGVTGMMLIYLLTGGYAGVVYNRVLQFILVFAVLLVVIGGGILAIGDLHMVLDNLHKLGQGTGVGINHYTDIMPHGNVFACLAAVLIAYAGISLLFLHVSVYQSNKASGFNVWSLLLKLLVIGLMVSGGILAIATLPTAKMLDANKQVVTITAQLPDGETGYVVKVVDSASKGYIPAPGLIPPLLNSKTGMMESNQYDYFLASTVALRNFLPKSFGGLIILVILSAFMFALSEYMLVGARSVLLSIIPFFKSEVSDSSGVWIVRLFIFFATSIALALAWFAMPYFNFVLWVYYVASVIVAPIVGLLMLSIFPKCSGNMTLPLLLGIVAAVMVWLQYHIESQFMLFGMSIICGFFVTFLIGVVAIYMPRSK